MKKLKLSDIIETERLIIEIPKVNEAKSIYNSIDENTIKYMTWEKWENYHRTEKKYSKAYRKL